uniref:BLOC-1-related complex subunit 7 n=1 Tax=Ditylenchus dipsaci TaxID=166011 RepID=A0A915DTQ9_9BILA
MPIAIEILSEVILFLPVLQDRIHGVVNNDLMRVATASQVTKRLAIDHFQALSKLMDYSLNKLRTKNWAMEDTIKSMQKAIQEMRASIKQLQDAAIGHENTLKQ